jgi:hypothetical protein
LPHAVREDLGHYFGRCSFDRVKIRRVEAFSVRNDSRAVPDVEVVDGHDVMPFHDICLPSDTMWGAPLPEDKPTTIALRHRNFPASN